MPAGAVMTRPRGVTNEDGAKPLTSKRSLGRLSRCFSLALVPIAMAPSAASAEGETVHARYSVSLIGLPFGAATVDGTLDRSGYRLNLGTKVTGLASILSSSKGAAIATGTLTDNHVRPATYATSATGSDMTRSTRMTIVNGNVDQAEITPPWNEFPDRVPVTEADRHGIVDPMSALIMPVPGTGDPIGPAACNRTIPVFDGAARFDVTLSYVGTRRAKTNGFDGTVAVCSARYVPIAGHRANRPGTRFMAENKQIEAWLAPVGQSRLVVPYRISVMTMIGTVVIEPTQFQVIESASPTPAR